MSTYASPLSSGKTSPKGFLRVFGKVFSGSGVLEATALTVSAQDTPDMTVKVSGSALDDNAVFIHTDGTFVQAWNESDANVTITANASGVTKTDAIVAYVDLTDYDASNANNPGSLKFIAVRRSGSNTGAPTSDEIEDSDVSTNPYIVLAHVTVANGAASINSGNITDERTFVKFMDDFIDTDQIADNAVKAPKIDWASTGADGGIWWEELGRASYSSGSSFTVSSFPARRYLRVILSLKNSGQIGAAITFNGDTAAHYAHRYNTDGGTENSAINSSYILIFGATSASIYAILEIDNFPTSEKLVSGLVIGSNNSGAGSAPNRNPVVGKWTNTTDSITSIRVDEGGTGSFTTNSQIIVLGHD